MNLELKTKININRVKEVGSLINNAKNILLVGHKNPDGDTVGCMTALMEYLKSLDKQYVAFIDDKVPKNLEYLRYSHEIVSDRDSLDNNFDLIIGLDCGDMRYSGIEDKLMELKERVKIINIDHHKSDYGQINIVDEHSSSTSMILCDIFRIWGVKISQDMATSFLAGIVVDTYSFSNSATSDKSLGLSAELIEQGGRYGRVNQELHKNKTKENLRLWSKVLSRLQKNDKLNVAYSLVLAEDIEEIGKEETEGMSNFFSQMKEARMTMILKEYGSGEIKVSLRAVDDKLDVAELARRFGGGGHRKAAGFSVYGRLEQEGNGWKII